MPRSRSTLAIIGCTALVAIGTITGVSIARFESAARFAPPSSPVIATIDLQKVFNGLNERSARQAELGGQGTTMQAELDKMVEAGKDEESKLKVLPEGSAEQKAAFERLQELSVNLKIKKELFESRLDQRRALVFREIFAKIAEASKRLAIANKYTVVMTADDTVDIPANRNTAETQQAIGAKRFLFIDPAHDVTLDLITMMNNEYKAPAGMPVAPAAVPVPTPGR